MMQTLLGASRETDEQIIVAQFFKEALRFLREREIVTFYASLCGLYEFLELVEVCEK